MYVLRKLTSINENCTNFNKTEEISSKKCSKLKISYFKTHQYFQLRHTSFLVCKNVTYLVGVIIPEYDSRAESSRTRSFLNSNSEFKKFKLVNTFCINSFYFDRYLLSIYCDESRVIVSLIGSERRPSAQTIRSFSRALCFVEKK